MYGIQDYKIKDGAYTTWDRWQDAEKRCEALEEENRRLKELLAEQAINRDSISTGEH